MKKFSCLLLNKKIGLVHWSSCCIEVGSMIEHLIYDSYMMLILMNISCHLLLLQNLCVPVNCSNSSSVLTFGAFTLWLLHGKPSSSADSFVCMKINSNSYLRNAENLIIYGLLNAVVTYEKYHYCLKN